MAIDTVVADNIQPGPQQDYASKLIAMQQNFDPGSTFTDPMKNAAFAKANMDIGNSFAKNAREGAQLNLEQRAEGFHEQNSTALLDLARKRQDLEAALFPAHLASMTAQTDMARAQLGQIDASAKTAALAANEKQILTDEQARINNHIIEKGVDTNDPEQIASLSNIEGVRPSTLLQYKAQTLPIATEALTKNKALNLKVEDNHKAVMDYEKYGDAPDSFIAQLPDKEASDPNKSWFRWNNQEKANYRIKATYDQLLPEEQKRMGWFDSNGNPTKSAPTFDFYDRFGNANEEKNSPLYNLSAMAKNADAIRTRQASGKTGLAQFTDTQIDYLESQGKITPEKADQLRVENVTQGAGGGRGASLLDRTKLTTLSGEQRTDLVNLRVLQSSPSTTPEQLQEVKNRMAKRKKLMQDIYTRNPSTDFSSLVPSSNPDSEETNVAPAPISPAPANPVPAVATQAAPAAAPVAQPTIAVTNPKLSKINVTIPHQVFKSKEELDAAVSNGSIKAGDRVILNGRTLIYHGK